MGVPKFDNEGRIVTAHYENLIVSNIYFPNGGQGPERLQYKFEFYEAFLEHVENLRKTNPVVWGGDVNTAHEEIDLARPRENQENTGFLPEERAWLDEVTARGWVDTFRHFYPEKEGAYTYWDMKTRARDRNVGWRIDYLFASPDLLPRLKKASIHSGVLGSDHCPISIDVEY
jgi:exodeoxyribonuclease-3